MSGAVRKRQKKLEKSRKKRELVKKQARKHELQCIRPVISAL